MKWFRLYDEILDDPKMFELTDKEKWIWIGTLCLANRSQNRGVLGKNWKTIRSLLHQKKETILAAFEKFESLGMVENGNEELRIVNWSKRQFETDNVYERVKRFRNVSRNVSKTLQETVPDTDTDTYTEKNNTIKVKLPHKHQELFDKVWEIYPRKVNKGRAFQVWKARIRAGLTPENVELAVRNYAAYCEGKDPQFIKHASTFFNPDIVEWIEGNPHEKEQEGWV